MLGTVLLFFLVMVLIGVLPIYGPDPLWGWGPSGVVGVLLVVLLVFVLMGRV